MESCLINTVVRAVWAVRTKMVLLAQLSTFSAMEDEINIYQPSLGNSSLSMNTKCYNWETSLLFPWPVTQQWLEDICFCASSWFIGLSAADLHTKWDFGTCLLVPSSETDYIKYSNGRSKKKKKKHQKDVACSCAKWSLRRVIGWHKKPAECCLSRLMVGKPWLTIKVLPPKGSVGEVFPSRLPPHQFADLHGLSLSDSLGAANNNA